MFVEGDFVFLLFLCVSPISFHLFGLPWRPGVGHRPSFLRFSLPLRLFPRGAPPCPCPGPPHAPSPASLLSSVSCPQILIRSFPSPETQRQMDRKGGTSSTRFSPTHPPVLTGVGPLSSQAPQAHPGLFSPAPLVGDCRLPRPLFVVSLCPLSVQ